MHFLRHCVTTCDGWLLKTSWNMWKFPFSPIFNIQSPFFHQRERACNRFVCLLAVRCPQFKVSFSNFVWWSQVKVTATVKISRNVLLPTNIKVLMQPLAFGGRCELWMLSCNSSFTSIQVKISWFWWNDPKSLFNPVGKHLIQNKGENLRFLEFEDFLVLTCFLFFHTKTSNCV